MDNTSYNTRVKIVLDVNQGMPIEKAAKLYGVNSEEISSWVEKVNIVKDFIVSNPDKDLWELAMYIRK